MSSPSLRRYVPNAPHVLREYAVIADGLRGAVVGPRGDLAWLCFPSWESSTVFDSLVGGSAAYDLHPDAPYVWGGYYEDGSLIWRDRWVTDAGAVVECRAALGFPGDPHRAVVLRRLRAERGAARMRAFLRARTDYGERGVRFRRLEGGEWVGRCGSLRVRWSGSSLARAYPQRSPAGVAVEFELAEGEQADLVLEIADEALPGELPDAETCWSGTESSWRESMPAYAETAAPRDARQAHAVLRGLSSPAGGTVAALTTSLPERAEEGRNYDYRYAWIRDQCFVGQAAAVAGAGLELLDGSVGFVAARLHEHGAALAPAYTTAGGVVPAERCLGFPGYPGGNAVAGNHAAKQFQLDALGEALSMFAAAARLERLDATGWRAAEVAVEAIEQRWREPDAGVWELDNRQWAHSRLACAGGLRSLCAAGAPAGHIGRWTSLADAMVAETARCCVHPTGRWQRAPDDARVDAALLFPPLRGATTVDDPRTVATYAAVGSELVDDGYVYRYRPDERPLGAAEGAFQLCLFAFSLAAVQQGDLFVAVRSFERGRAACGPAGLFTEEFDVQQRQLRGNLPQVFVHALFLETAAVLGRHLAAEPRPPDLSWRAPPRGSGTRRRPRSAP